MTLVLKDKQSHVQKTEFSQERFRDFFFETIEKFVSKNLKFKEEIIEKIICNVIEKIEEKSEVTSDFIFSITLQEIDDLTSPMTPELRYLSAGFLLRKIRKESAINRGFDYRDEYGGDYYAFVKMMVEKGIYDESLIEQYTKEEIREIGSFIKPERDFLFDLAGLQLFNLNYMKKGYDNETLELPQERYMTVVMYLMKDEDKSKRMEYIKLGYWATSSHYLGLATPTLSNAGTPNGTLSSCHIITMNDDLMSIFDVLKDTAKFSQNGAGIGIFLGFLRSANSWIRGRKNIATGILHPCRLIGNLSEYVNQLGVRKGAVSVYLPVWHRDIKDFLDLRLKTGTQEKRSHSIFTAVTIPDEFMRRLDARSTWTVFDPYEVKKKFNIDINRLYDKKKLLDGEEPNEKDHAFTYWYRFLEQQDMELKTTLQAVQIFKPIYEAQMTGGTPFMYFSDTSARMNPNEHEGMPFGSNLCY